MKKCCIIGHRQIKNIEVLKTKAKSVIMNLIINESVDTFLFGSKSDFDNFCYEIVSELIKIDKLNITRIKYACNGELGFTTEEKEKYDKIVANFFKNGLKDYEEVKRFQHLEKSGKASYIERNKMLIDDADICLFYYEYKEVCEVNEHLLNRNSGTNIAYNYAISRNKKIINIATFK